MHKLTLYPLGNADTSLIELANGKLVLIDYAAMRDPNDPRDKRVDLPVLLREKLKKLNRTYMDVVGFTHLDIDHIKGATEFFYLEHAAKYQGGDRIKIKTLWVPAAVILEDGLDDEARIIRQEARHRLIEGKGIRVFSAPDALSDWLKAKGINPKDRAHLISDAGTLAPEFNLATDGIEFFIHSPFAKRMNEQETVVRNTDALVLQATFQEDNVLTRTFFPTDIDYDLLADIVVVTEMKKRPERLQNDVIKVPHHCSYKSIGPEKGKTKTEPDPAVKRFYETYAQKGVMLLSSSWTIPSNDDDKQPPHRQAAAYYREVAESKAGQFRVTMDHPTKASPGPMEIETGRNKAKLKLPPVGGPAVIVGATAPRAG